MNLLRWIWELPRRVVVLASSLCAALLLVLARWLMTPEQLHYQRLMMLVRLLEHPDVRIELAQHCPPEVQRFILRQAVLEAFEEQAHRGSGWAVLGGLTSRAGFTTEEVDQMVAYVRACEKIHKLANAGGAQG